MISEGIKVVIRIEGYFWDNLSQRWKSLLQTMSSNTFSIYCLSEKMEESRDGARNGSKKGQMNMILQDLP